MTTTRIPCIGGPLDGQQAAEDHFHVFDGGIYKRTSFQGMRFFIASTMGYLAARREMRRLYAAQGDHLEYARPYALRVIEEQAGGLVEHAESIGVVLTITQRPLQPLGMAHYETVVEVRPVQVPK